MFINKKNNFTYGNNKYDNKSDIYVSHPFTNWSLNPKFEYNKIREHTDEGFRKVMEINSLSKQLETYDKSNKIYCMGGSSTYCTTLNGFNKSWPAKLQNKIDPNESVIINAGVGGWGTMQSLIRFIGWSSIIKPKIVIIYQSKNDLTPFYNGRKKQNKIFPLLENVMVQFDRAKMNNNTFYKKYRNFIKYLMKKSNNDDLGILYTEEIYKNKSGFKRFDNNFLNTSIQNYQIVIDIVKKWDGKVLFIPELINETSIYYKHMEKIHKKAKELLSHNNNFFFYNIKDLITMNKKNFIDNKMHFSEDGCAIFSKIVFNIINKINKKN